MPSEDTQFTRNNLPARRGLPPLTKEVSTSIISFRPYAEDLQRLNNKKDKATFIRDAVRLALDAEA